MKTDDLLALIDREDTVHIQTHDFPDHDSVASAFALQVLLRQWEINASLVYGGRIQDYTVSRLITDFAIPIHPASSRLLKPTDKIIIVDGCKGNKNITDIIGREVAIIDHHDSVSPPDVPFSDIRSDYGSCSTIIYSYYRERDIPIQDDVATVLLVGLLTDTALMTRAVSGTDMEMYTSLYNRVDSRTVNSLLRNKIRSKDLHLFRQAIDTVRLENGFAYCFFSDGCPENLLGILGDFFLTVSEIRFVLLCARNDGRVNLSARSEQPEWNAGVVIRRALEGLGFGGGHPDMAGGVIENPEDFDSDQMYLRLRGILESLPAGTA